MSIPVATARIAALQVMLDSRMSGDKPLKGYAENVRHLRAEIACLQAGKTNAAPATAFPSPPGTPIDLNRQGSVLAELAASRGVVYRKHPTP